MPSLKKIYFGVMALGAVIFGPGIAITGGMGEPYAVRFSTSAVLAGEVALDRVKFSAEEIAEEAASETRIPRVYKRLSACEPVIQLCEQRPVLMIKVHSEDCHIAVRNKAEAEVNKLHYGKGNQCRYQNIFVVFQKE